MWRKLLKFYYRLKVLLLRDKKLVAQDMPDPRDIRATGIGRINTPNTMDLFAKAITLGMIFPKQATNACTAFALTVCRMILDTIFNGKMPPYTADFQWSLQLATGGSTASGDYSQNALKQGENSPQGYPFIYARFGRIRKETHLDQMVKWIARTRTLYTMVYWNIGAWYAKPLLKISNYAEMLKLGWIVSVIGKRLGAHQICIGGYDKNKELPDGTVGLAFKYYEPMQKKDGGFGWIAGKDLVNTGLCGNVYIISDLMDKEFTK